MSHCTHNCNQGRACTCASGTEKMGTLSLKLRAKSGYSSDIENVHITPEQWGDIQNVANGAATTREDELVAALHVALPFVEDHACSGFYKPGAVAKALQKIRMALTERPGRSSLPTG